MNNRKLDALRALPIETARATLECYGWRVKPITRYAVTNPTTGETTEVSGATLRELIIAQIRLDRPLMSD